MKIIYRISDAGYNKVKPAYINNESCLRNFCNVFFEHIHDIRILADNCSETTIDMIKRYIDPVNIHRVSVGHGAGTFNVALDMALTYDDNEIVYFVENDYIHLQKSPQIINEVMALGADYGTLYVHPDKFIQPSRGGNPEVGEDGGYLTRIYRGETQLYYLVNSTTMTFFSRVSHLHRDEDILRKHTSGTYPDDFHMFIELRNNNRTLLCPLNTFSTHGETMWLAPLYKIKQDSLITEWSKHIQNG